MPFTPNRFTLRAEFERFQDSPDLSPFPQLTPTDMKFYIHRWTQSPSGGSDSHGLSGFQPPTYDPLASLVIGMPVITTSFEPSAPLQAVPTAPRIARRSSPDQSSPIIDRTPSPHSQSRRYIPLHLNHSFRDPVTNLHTLPHDFAEHTIARTWYPPSLLELLTPEEITTRQDRSISALMASLVRPQQMTIARPGSPGLSGPPHPCTEACPRNSAGSIRDTGQPSPLVWEQISREGTIIHWHMRSTPLLERVNSLYYFHPGWSFSTPPILIKVTTGTPQYLEEMRQRIDMYWLAYAKSARRNENIDTTTPQQ